MKTIAEIDVQPVGEGVSIREQVARAVELLGRSGLRTRIHALGTEVEGELSQVFEAVGAIHDELHRSGVQRLVTTLKIETRTDHEVDLDDAVYAVEGLTGPEPASRITNA